MKTRQKNTPNETPAIKSALITKTNDLEPTLEQSITEDNEHKSETSSTPESDETLKLEGEASHKKPKAKKNKKKSGEKQEPNTSSTTTIQAQIEPVNTANESSNDAIAEVKESENKPQVTHSKEALEIALQKMRNTQIEEKVSHFRAQAIDALSAAIKEESDLTKLNTQFLYFRKMDQLAQHIIQNPYNGNTRQRIEAHAVLKHEIINKYNDCIQYPLKAIDSHSSLEKVYNQEITKIKVDYARNSMTQYSAYKYTLGLLFGESSSKTASKLNKAGEEADNINQTNMLDFK